MQRADYVASFIGHEAGKAPFIGLYRRGKWRPMTYEQYWRKPEYKEMGVFGMRGFVGERESILWFDLKLTDFHKEWKGRLVVDWPPPELAWWRWADKNRIPVFAIHERSILDAEMPPWDEMKFSWKELKLLPAKWQIALRQWRGIYFIFDKSDGKGYVGSAYGKENILGRWLNYAKRGHGGNKELRKRDPSHFRFSILQLGAPDTDPTEIRRLESSWKDRLHTREFGMNEN
jgi:GIY-YIG catalytic domain